jgi:hypothetical protein
MKKTKAAQIAQMLKEGDSVTFIKRMLGVSESYIYTIKKLLANNVEVGIPKAVKETILSMDTDLSFTKPGEFIQADTNVDTILNERANTYGSFIGVAQIAQEMKDTIRGSLDEQNVSLQADHQEALDMIASKIARIITGDSNHIDSWIDIAGYATLVADRLQGKIR